MSEQTPPTPNLPAAPAPPQPPAPKPLTKRVGHSMLLIRIIAIDKFVKGACLIVIGTFILHMIRDDKNLHDTLHDFVNDLRIDPNNKYIHNLLEKTLGVSERTLRLFYTGTLIYAALYLIEGLGLFFDKAWAEWMTIIATALFLPLEIVEICRDVTLFRVIVFILNVLMVIYLGMRLQWRHQAKMAGVDLKKDPEAVHYEALKAPDETPKALPPDGNVP
jgi:uncharacterized membrane protein (DUF2068 family)